MKKSLIALAALAATGAFAQSSVTLYGQADAAYTSVKSGANSLTGVLGAGRGSNFVGFMGTEDLGGGWAANFKLEAQYNLDTGVGATSNANNQLNGGLVTVTGASSTATTTGASGDRASIGGAQGLTFNRWSYAGLSNAGVGEFRVGREYTPTFQAVLAADTTGANGVQNTLFQTLYLGQANSHANVTSASNGISYESPSFSGLKAKVQVFYGENTTPSANTNWMNAKSGDGNSYHASYTNGPLSACYGAQKTKGTAVAAATAGTAIPGQYDVATAYAKYDFGFALLTAASTTEKLVSAADGNLKNSSTTLGFSIPVTGTALKINGTYITSKYSDDGVVTAKGNKTGLQALYSMSKRTDLYANYAVTDNTLGKTYGIVNGAGRFVAIVSNGHQTTSAVNNAIRLTQSVVSY